MGRTLTTSNRIVSPFSLDTFTTAVPRRMPEPGGGRDWTPVALSGPWRGYAIPADDGTGREVVWIGGRSVMQVNTSRIMATTLRDSTGAGHVFNAAEVAQISRLGAALYNATHRSDPRNNSGSGLNPVDIYVANPAAAPYLTSLLGQVGANYETYNPQDFQTAWCAEFTSRNANRLGGPEPFMVDGKVVSFNSANDFVEHYRQRLLGTRAQGRLEEMEADHGGPKPGDYVAIAGLDGTSGDWDHVATVLYHDSTSGILYTIDGNYQVGDQTNETSTVSTASYALTSSASDELHSPVYDYYFMRPRYGDLPDQRFREVTP